MVRTVRGGTKPWITRYVMSVGGAGTSLSPDGTKLYVRYLHDVSWSDTLCEFTKTFYWMEFERVIDGETDYYLLVQTHTSDPNP
jgi:hypothetical protein